MTFCANFSRLSNSAWPVKQNDNLFQDYFCLQGHPNWLADDYPKRGNDPSRSNSHSAKTQNNWTPAQRTRSTKLLKLRPRSIKPLNISIQLQWLGFGFRSALNSRLALISGRDRDQTLGLRSVVPLAGSLWNRIPRSTQSCRGAKQCFSYQIHTTVFRR